MVKNILVATDSSPAANRALVFAAEMAAHYDATLHVLYVIRSMQVPENLLRLAEVEKLEGPRDEVLTFVAGKVLHDAQNRAKAAGATRVQTVVGQGDPASVIIDESDARDIDLIVVGTRGLGKIKSEFLGSVSRKVTNLSKKNCVIVR